MRAQGKPFGDRVLRVRIRVESDDRIVLAADSAVKALRSRGITAVLDQLPPRYPPMPGTMEWTEDAELSQAVTLWAGDDPEDPVAQGLVDAWSYAYGGAREFISSYERVNGLEVARALNSREN